MIEYFVGELIRIKAKLDLLPPSFQKHILRALQLSLALDMDLGRKMLGEIERISIVGVDPDWQMLELEKITKRFGVTN